jgi:putative DNA primase/helicase
MTDEPQPVADHDYRDFLLAADSAAKACAANDGQRAVAILRLFRGVLEGECAAEAIRQIAIAFRDRGVPDGSAELVVELATQQESPAAVTPARTTDHVAASPIEADPFWHNKLLHEPNRPDKKLGNAANVLKALRTAPEWQGAIGFNTFALQDTFRRQPPFATTQTVPWQVADADIVLVQEWMQVKGVNASFDTVGKAICTIAREQKYSPVAEYLSSLVHDGQPRVDTWLIEHLGAEDTPLHRMFGRKFLIAAVARALHPDCKVDTMLILEGRQGLKKSTALRTLFSGEWFTDHVEDLSNKDARQQLHGVWCVEFAELDTLSRADAAKVKSWLSTQTDKIRLPYDRTTGTFHRQCVFSGSINPGGTGYLKDETGGRRFWPVECGVEWEDDRKVDMERLALVRDQLWAEAVALYRAGESWWLDDKYVERDQAEAVADRYDSDPWAPSIITALRDPDFIVLTDDADFVRPGKVFSDVLHIALADRSKAHSMRLGGIMKSLGWTRWQRRDGQSREWVYLRPSDWTTLPRQQGDGDAPIAAADILPFSPRSRR